MHEKEISSLLEELLRAIGVSFDSVEWVTLPAHPLLNIHTTESHLLIGPRGETLRALSIVFQRLLEQRMKDAPEQVSYIIDVNGYRKVRLDEIQQQAHLLAERVRSLHTRAELSPMNAYERLIVHATFTDDPEVTTRSEGEGSARHVVLLHR